MAGSSTTLVTLLISVLLCAPAFARDHGQYNNVDPAIRNWVHGLKDNKGASCCDFADGYPAEAEWDMQTGHYRVRLQDPRYPDKPAEWFEVPDDKVITEPNRLGYAVVWWYPEYGGGVESKFMPRIRCFIPGGGV